MRRFHFLASAAAAIIGAALPASAFKSALAARLAPVAPAVTFGPAPTAMLLNQAFAALAMHRDDRGLPNYIEADREADRIVCRDAAIWVATVQEILVEYRAVNIGSRV